MMTHPEYCTHCNATLDDDTHFTGDGDRVCGACHKADLTEQLDEQGVDLASRTLYVVTGVLAIVVGLGLIAWEVHEFLDGYQGRRDRPGVMLAGGVGAIVLGVQQLRREY